jgi:hypothetical protein
MSATYRDIWKRLYDASQSCLDTLTKSRQPTTQAVSQTSQPAQLRTFPQLNLSVPADFTDFIYGLQLPASTLKSALVRIDKVIDEQKTIHETKYQELCNKFLHLNRPSTSSQHIDYFGSIKKTHERSFERQLARIKESVLNVYENLQTTSSQSKKPIFNAVSHSPNASPVAALNHTQEYTPVLEQYFEYNAYPSARDRELLARKSSMTARQIEVWVSLA